MLLSLLEEMNRPPSLFQTITQDQYQDWQRGFVFERLRDQRYGQSFCNHFGITDYVLFYKVDWESADQHIRTVYLVQP